MHLAHHETRTRIQKETTQTALAATRATPPFRRRRTMQEAVKPLNPSSWSAKIKRTFLSSIAALTFATSVCAVIPSAEAQQPQKPNILFIMGDDIGWMQPSIYHRGLMVGETPNIDRIGNEGAMFMHYYAEQS